MMNGEAKIGSAHRDRLAVIYLRQSSMAQVREHAESAMRQYGLVEVAVGLGWALVRTILLLIVVPALITDRDLRGLHDRAANTIVIRT